MRFIERAPRVLPTLVTFHFISNGADQNHNLSISIAQAWIRPPQILGIIIEGLYDALDA